MSLPTPDTSKLPGFDIANMDPSVSACSSFFQYANGGWIARNPVPPAFSRWGRFEVLDEGNLEVLHGILDSMVKKKGPRQANEKKIADFYGSCMDEAGIEAEGAKPLQGELDRIAGINDMSGLQAEIARFHTYRIPAVFGFGAGQDFKNSQAVIAQAVQGGLGLPDRDYYTKDEEKPKREEYSKHITRMFELLGDSPERAGEEARTVLNIETKLAEKSSTRVQRRDPEANYHPMNRSELSELTPHIDWRNYFDGVGLHTIDKINVGQPEFFKAADKLLASIPVDDWKTYLRWHLINSAASTLSSKFVQEDFNFNGKYLQGTKEMLPRWRRCVASTDRALGEALGQLYIQKTFPPAARARAQGMVKNLVEALRSDLTTLSWMSDETRKRAITKLDAFIRKIGYPDKWRSYEALQISKGAYYNNAVNARQFDVKRNLGKIGSPVDKTEWGMTPPTVNAYYNPTINEIVFPAGILPATRSKAKALARFCNRWSPRLHSAGAKGESAGSQVAWHDRRTRAGARAASAHRERRRVRRATASVHRAATHALSLGPQRRLLSDPIPTGRRAARSHDPGIAFA